MNPRSLLLHAIVISATVLGCSEPEPEPEPEPLPLPTPPAVASQFRSLLQAADEERPGAAVASLREFMNENLRYEIVTEVEAEIDDLTSGTIGRYSAAREIARGGDFDRAEGMLEDLATHLPDTPDGESSKEHLAFEFYLHEAQWLMVRQRWQESEAVARPLVERELTRTQREQVESILDGVSQVGAALSQATRAQTRAVCRHVMILLETIQAEEGAYPSTLSLSDVENRDPIGSRSILRGLSAIESYRQTGRGYSFVAVSADGQDRIRVVDGMIED